MKQEKEESYAVRWLQRNNRNSDNKASPKVLDGTPLDWPDDIDSTGGTRDEQSAEVASEAASSVLLGADITLPSSDKTAATSKEESSEAAASSVLYGANISLPSNADKTTATKDAGGESSEAESSVLFGANITLPSSDKTSKETTVSSKLYGADITLPSSDKQSETSKDAELSSPGEVEVFVDQKTGLDDSREESGLNVVIQQLSTTDKATESAPHSDRAVPSPMRSPHRGYKSSGSSRVPPEMIAIPVLDESGEPVNECASRRDDVSAITNPTAVRTVSSLAPWMRPIGEYDELDEEEEDWHTWKRNRRIICCVSSVVVIFIVVACIFGILASVGVFEQSSSQRSTTSSGPVTNPPSTPVPTILVPPSPPPETASPTLSPTMSTGEPTLPPTMNTGEPTLPPTTTPTVQPSLPPTITPTVQPTLPPSTFPPTADLSLSGARVSLASNAGILGVGLNIGSVRTYRVDQGSLFALNQPTISLAGELAIVVSGDGSRMVLGAEDEGLSGQAQVWTRDVSGPDGGPWSLLGGDLVGEVPGGQFGQAVAISADGSTVAVGAPGANGATGQVTCFRRLNDSGPWTTVASANGVNPGDAFGTSVSLSNDGSTLAVGAPQRSVAWGKGYVQMYTLEESALEPSGGPIEGEGIGDRFGSSVSVADNLSAVAVGAWGNDVNGEDSGHARVFARSGTTWGPVGDPVRGDAPGDAFGYSASLSADGATLAIGAPQSFTSRTGYIRVFRFAGGTWATAETYQGDPGRQLGFSISLGQDSRFISVAWGSALLADGTARFGYYSLSSQ